MSSCQIAPKKVDLWQEAVNEGSVRRYWLSIAKPKHRTTICVLLWTARKEFHGGEPKSRSALQDISRKLRVSMGDVIAEGLMVLLKRYSPADLLCSFRQLEREAGKPATFGVR